MLATGILIGDANRFRLPNFGATASSESMAGVFGLPPSSSPWARRIGGASVRAKTVFATGTAVDPEDETAGVDSVRAADAPVVHWGVQRGGSAGAGDAGAAEVAGAEAGSVVGAAATNSFGPPAAAAAVRPMAAAVG